MIRSLLGALYRKCAAPFGLRALDRMLRHGLPARLDPPLRSLLSGRVPAEADAIAARIERRRADIAASPDKYAFEYGGSSLGTTRWPERTEDAAGFSSRRLATSTSVQRRWGVFLHLCAEAYGARAILELGACVGISGAYLASIRSRPRFISVEGSSALAPVAEATLAAVTDRAAIVRAPFESGVLDALARFAEETLTVDVAYVDGHHDEAATLHYVRTIVPHLSAEGLVILDDISLYEEMWRAWQTLASMPGVAAAVNVGRFGLLVWSGGEVTARHYDLARYTGWWRLGGSRRDALRSTASTSDRETRASP